MRAVFHDSYIDGLVQERRNYSASAMELRLSCTKPERHNSSVLAMELRLSCTQPLICSIKPRCVNKEAIRQQDIT